MDLGAGTITVTAGVTEADPLATYTVAWTLTQNGIGIGTATGTSYHVPDPEPARRAGRDRDRDRQRWRGGLRSAQLVLIDRRVLRS